jgi:L-lactate dehydrogenase complex protein LldF
VRSGLAFWGWFAKRPRLYGWATGLAAFALGFVGQFRGRFHWLPLARGWTQHRDFPAPQGRTFQSQWRARERQSGRRR